MPDPSALEGLPEFKASVSVLLSVLTLETFSNTVLPCTVKSPPNIKSSNSISLRYIAA